MAAMVNDATGDDVRWIRPGVRQHDGVDQLVMADLDLERTADTLGRTPVVICQYGCVHLLRGHWRAAGSKRLRKSADPSTLLTLVDVHF